MRTYPHYLGLKLTTADRLRLTELAAASGLSQSALMRTLLRRTLMADVRPRRAAKRRRKRVATR